MLYLKPKKFYSVLCVYEMRYNTQKKKCIFVIKFIGGPLGFLHLVHLCSVHGYTPLLS
jgi:hypothetical protein